MNSEYKTAQSSQFFLLLLIFIIPLVGLYEGLSYLIRNNRQIETSLAAQNLVKLRHELQSHNNEENFLTAALSKAFTQNSSMNDLEITLNNLLNTHKSALEFMIFNSKGKWHSDNFKADADTLNQFKNSGKDLQRIVGRRNSGPRYRAHKNLRPLVGRHFFIPTNREHSLYLANRFFQTDYLDDTYRYWFGRDAEKLLMVRSKPKQLIKDNGLKIFYTLLNKEEFAVSRFVSDNLQKNMGIDKLLANIAYKKLCSNVDIEFLEYENYLHTIAAEKPGEIFLLSCRLPPPPFKPGTIVKSLILVIIMLLVIFRSYAFKLEDLSLLKQISLLMGISLGLPLVFLGFAAAGYFNSKHGSMIKQKHNQMIEFIQDFDNNIYLDHIRINRRIESALELSQDILQGKINRAQILKNFVSTLGKKFNTINIVREVRDDKQRLTSREIHHLEERGGADERLAKRERESLTLLANQLLSHLSGLSPEKVSSEMLYIVEVFFQKTVEIVINDIISIESNLTSFPWGSTDLLIFSKGLSVRYREIFDHYLMVSFDPLLVQNYYILENISRLLRNPYGFMVFVARGSHFYNEKTDLRNYPEMQILFSKVNPYPLPQPEIFNFQGHDHILVGLEGARLDGAKFCLMYPVKLIDREIEKEARDLVYLVAVTVTIILAMLLILYIHLLGPVNRLYQAARALEARDCDFRLPETRGDEFAEMARIFNQSMSEFEELRIASIVQTKLLPQKELKAEGFSIFGKSLPMIELGGDYFDYFSIDENHFALLLGDVAGHGVGASLIMAMTKAGVICSSDLMLDPGAMLNCLHKIVLSIKTRTQRKVMTFQYVAVERQSRKVIYANAGGCTPVIINPTTGEISGVENPAPVLGGFKKTTYSNIEFAMLPGQALVFYTDGMVESRNSKNVELGYQGLYDLFVKCYHTDAAEYYSNILNLYRQWLDGAEVGDDMTLIIMVCLPDQT